MPYKDLTIQQVLVQVPAGHRLIVPPNCPEEIGDIMTMCWLEESSNRPNFDNLAIHFESMREGGTRGSSQARQSGRLEFAGHHYLDFLYADSTMFNPLKSRLGSLQIPPQRTGIDRRRLAQGDLTSSIQPFSSAIHSNESGIVSHPPGPPSGFNISPIQIDLDAPSNRFEERYVDDTTSNHHHYERPPSRSKFENCTSFV